MKPSLKDLKVAACVVGITFSTLAGNVQAQKASAQAAFSFDVYGDSRSMMYLPHKADQEADASKLMVDMFELSLPASLPRIKGVRERVAYLRAKAIGTLIEEVVDVFWKNEESILKGTYPTNTRQKMHLLDFPGRDFLSPASLRHPRCPDTPKFRNSCSPLPAVLDIALR